MRVPSPARGGLGVVSGRGRASFGDVRVLLVPRSLTVAALVSHLGVQRSLTVASLGVALGLELLMLRPRVRDDRGEVWKLVAWVGRPAAVALQHARPLQRFVFVGAVLLGALIGVLPVLAAFDWLRQTIDRWALPEGAAPTSGGHWAGGITMAALILVPMIVGAIVVGGVAWRRVGPRLLRGAACCPSCASGLKGLAMEADGCTVCPECGAAWRLRSS